MESDKQAMEPPRKITPAERTRLRRKLSSKAFYDYANKANVKDPPSNLTEQKVSETAPKISVFTEEVSESKKEVVKEMIKVSDKAENTAVETVESTSQTEAVTEKPKRFVKCDVIEETEGEEATDEEGELCFETASENISSASCMLSLSEGLEGFTDEGDEFPEVDEEVAVERKEDNFGVNEAKVVSEEKEEEITLEVDESCEEELECTVVAKEVTVIEEEFNAEEEGFFVYDKWDGDIPVYNQWVQVIPIFECKITKEGFETLEELLKMEFKVPDVVAVRKEEVIVEEEEPISEEEEEEVKENEIEATFPGIENFIKKFPSQLRVLQIEADLLKNKVKLLSRKIDSIIEDLKQHEKTYEISELELLEMTQVSYAARRFRGILEDYIYQH